MPNVVMPPAFSQAMAKVQAERDTADLERGRAPSGCPEHPDREVEKAACAADFAHFLQHWVFRDREKTGIDSIMRFDHLWDGQTRMVESMQAHRWVYILKAGKLGATELECAYDGWVVLFRGSNARTNIFSKNQDAAKELLGIVKFGLQHLPDWLALPLMSKAEAGGDNSEQFTLIGEGADDIRRVVSYPASPDAAIDVSATHSHVDEMARMPFPGKTWASIASTVPPDGTVHIVTRGAGEGSYASELWYEAKDGISPLHCHFEPFNARPRIPQGEVPPGADPAEVWYAEQAATTLASELNYSAPRTEEDALKGSAEGQFVPEAVWLANYDPDLPPLMPGDRTPIVLGVDAGVTGDNFAVVAVSRHPDRPLDPAVRMVKVWQPPKNGAIDFDEVERFLRIVCLGGCVNMHPNRAGNVMSDGEMCAEHPQFVYQHKVTGLETCSAGPIPCDACAAGTRTLRFNVAQIAYDAYQLVDMMQRLSRERVAWCRAFSQGSERLESDARLRSLIMNRRMAHRNDATLNAHVAAANAKSAPGEETKLRLVKRNPGSKIDAAVGLSMGTSECLRLILQNAR